MLQDLLHCFGLKVPRDYCCTGLVTTGLGFGYSANGTSAPDQPDDLIVQIGYCGVTGGRVDAQQSWVLNWTEMEDFIDSEWLERKLEDITDDMDTRGKKYPMTYDMIQQSTCHPVDGLQQFVKLLDDDISAGKMLVGHNLIGFGLPVLADATQEWLGCRFEVPSDCVLDLGLIEKARQMNEYPVAGESLSDFQLRVFDMRGGGRWGMEHCVSEYGLLEKYPCEERILEDAEYKALTIHRLMQEMASSVPAHR